MQHWMPLPDRGIQQSKITDKDDAVWVVTDVTKGNTYHINYVEKKPAEKKP